MLTINGILGSPAPGIHPILYMVNHFTSNQRQIRFMI